MAKLVIQTEMDTSGVKEGLVDIEELTKQLEEKIGRNITKTEKDALQNEIGDVNEILQSFEDKLNEFYTAYNEASSGNILFKSDTEHLLELKKEVNEMIPLIEKITDDKIIIPGVNDAVKEIPKINTGLNSVIKNVTRWGLALMGIRSIYGYIRKAVSEVTQEDEGLKNQIQYVSFAIGTVLKPVVEWLINAVYKILSIFGGIIKAITGINIFAKATANNFAKANSSAGALRKTLAGFDEMNVINENGGTGLLGGLADLKVPDLASQVEQQASKIKEWFTKGLPTREELEANANTYKNSWIRVGEFLGLGTLFNDFRTRLDELKKQLEPIWQPVIDGFNEMVNIIKITFKPFTDYIDEHFIKPIKTKFTEWKDDFLSKYAKFINKLIYFANLFLQYFGIQLDYIDEESALTSDDIKENFKKSFDDTQKNLDEKMVKPFGKFKKTLQDLTNKTWSIVVNFVLSGKEKLNQQLEPLRKSLSSIGIKLPYLAKGGIVNMPSRGVPVGNAIAGERGAEGVIPLTDSQQMALLGEAIGKYITMNATVPVYIGNRLVMREMKRIKAEDDFAYNR